MSGINFLSDNLVDAAQFSITTGSENAQFPISNLSIESPSYKFRSTGNTVVVVVDLQQTAEIDTVAIAGSPIDGLGATNISIKTSVTTDFSSSTSIPLTIYPESAIAYSFITQVSHRFVEITLTGTGTFSEMSNVFIGKRFNLPSNSLSLSSFGYTHSEKSTTVTNRYGQKFIDKRNKQKIISGQIDYCTKDEFELLDDMFINKSTTNTLWLILDPDSEAMNDGASRLAIYCYLSAYPRWSAAGGQLYNASALTFEEAI